MKEIKIDDNFSMKVDRYNINIYYASEEKINKDGKSYKSNNTTYYPNVRLALKAYVQKSLEQENSIQELINKIDFLEDKIDQIKWPK
jgi:hypothetical protein